MNRKSLFLLIAAVVTSGTFVKDSLTVQAEETTSSQGAIIYQLPADNTKEFLEINKKTPGEFNLSNNIKAIQYYERNALYKLSDDLFADTIRAIWDFSNNNEEKRQQDFLVLDDFITEKLNQEPYNARYLFRQSMIKRNLNDITSSHKALFKALEIDKNNPVYLYELANMYLDENLYHKAIKILEVLKKQYPKKIEYRTALAQAYTRAGKYDDAIKEYKVAVNFDPQNNETIIALNDLTQYNEMAKNYGNNFYDPMRSVYNQGGGAGQPQGMGQGPQPQGMSQGPQPQNIVLGSQPQRMGQGPQPQGMVQASQPQRMGQGPQPQGMVQASQPQRMGQGPQPQGMMQGPQSQRMGQGPQPQGMMQRQQTQEMMKNYQKSVKKPLASSKRVLVTYVNGRKVVKIVNLNTDTNPTSLEVASNSLNNQLASSNSRPEVQTTNNTTTEQYTFAPSKTQNSVKTQPASYPTTSKYQLSTNEYVVSGGSNYQNEKPTAFQQTTEVTASGNPNVNALKNKSAGQKQLIVKYENGKKVIKTVSANDNINKNQNNDFNKTQINAVEKTQNITKKEQEKTKKQSKSKTEQNKKQEKAKNTENTKTTSNVNKDNSDLYIKANEYIVQEQFQSAIDVLKQVQPPTLRSLTAIASCYNSLGQIDTAIEYYKQADKMSPANSQILYSIGYLYYAKNDITSAQKYVDMALAKDETNQNALQLKKYMSQNASNETVNKAVAYMNENKFSEARKILEKLIQEKPNDFQAYYYLGHIYYATQKYEDSAKNFSLSIKNNPDYALSYYSIGLAYDKLKEFNKSIKAYEQFLLMENDDNKYTQYAKTRINTIKSKQ